MTKSGVRQQRQQQTRERLLDASAAVFARRGYGEASVPDIAAEAQTSTGAIYSNFTGKEDLFLELMAREMRAGAERRLAAAIEGDSPDEVLQQLVRDWTSMVDTQPNDILLMMEFWLYAVRREPLQHRIAELFAGVRTNLTAVITRLGGPGAETYAPGLATSVQAVAYGHALQRIADPDAVSDEDFLQALRSLIMGAGARL